MRLEGESATRAVGTALAPLVRAGDVIALSGDLGAGKSSLARGLIQGLGFAGDVPSPTFSIVIPYFPPDVRLPVWHVDLYRLDPAGETDELGLDDALDDGVLIIEWPSRLGHALWPQTLHLTLDGDGEGARRLTAAVPPSWEPRWPFP